MSEYIGCSGHHHGIGTWECPRNLHHHHDAKCTPSPLGERRQRAREAFQDIYDVRGTLDAAEEAIETATRVRVTPEIVEAFKAIGHPLPLEPNIKPAIEAAFRAAGFEVEE